MPRCTQCGQRELDGGLRAGPAGFPEDATGLWYCHGCWTEWFRMQLEAWQRFQLCDVTLATARIPKKAWRIISDCCNEYRWP